MAAVLWKQHEQRRWQKQQQQQPAKQEEAADLAMIDLGMFARQSSLRSKRSALARATLSCRRHQRAHCLPRMLEP